MCQSLDKQSLLNISLSARVEEYFQYKGCLVAMDEWFKTKETLNN